MICETIRISERYYIIFASIPQRFPLKEKLQTHLTSSQMLGEIICCRVTELSLAQDQLLALVI